MKRICKYVLCSLIVYILAVSADAQEPPKVAMFAHFIDVGQGDATLLEFPTGAVLIDAGAQDPKHRDDLIAYLRRFFKRRCSLKNTLDLVLITHNHVDHNYVLDSIATIFHVKNYIDNGLAKGSGRKNQLWLERNAAQMGIKYRSITYEDVLNSDCDGLQDSMISPVHGGVLAPQIHILSGTFRQKPETWYKSDYNNGNNHSLVVKVTFGRSSFLFTGDLEIAGLKSLVKRYLYCNTLDVDILRVGHHGANNATTQEFLNAVTPLSAIISCGAWNYGIGPPPKRFTTFTYGHPRTETLAALEAIIPGFRSVPITIKVGDGATRFHDQIVRKEIYATPWDHYILLEATSNGQYTPIK